MTDPSHPEGQSPVQPTCEVCGAFEEHACPETVDAGYDRLVGIVARLRAELAQQKQFGLDRLAQHVEEEQAAHAENATLRAQLSEKEAEIARLKEDEWRAWGDCRDGKCNACPKCCDAARAAQAKAEQERDEALRVAFEGEGK